MLNAPERACLLIADISGYTSYLAGVELDHAQDILADLVGTVVSALRPTFKLAKLEGDAAFTWAPAERVDGSLLLDTIERCYFGFRRRRRDVRQATSCECDACIRIPNLDLKFVVHQGTVARQRMAGLEELVGADVIVVHRLLKNTVVESTGIEAYALFSQAVVDATALRPEELGMRRHAEAYDHIGEVPVWIHDLDRRWAEEDARARVLVAPGKGVYTHTSRTAAPPQVAWDFLTKPGRRVGWMTGVTDVIQDAPGNRRGVGATNHCMHGPDAILEEVLDWRPFDYYTLRTTLETPGGPVRVVSTTELEPTPDGTLVHMRFAQPGTKREREAWAAMLPMFEGVFSANAVTLGRQLAAEVAARDDGAAEPAVPTPSPDGLFSEMPTLLIVG